MKLLLLITLALSGCAYTNTKKTPSEARKGSMMKCVADFLDRDVAPRDSLGICTTVYSRWEESEYSKTAVNKGNKSD